MPNTTRFGEDFTRDAGADSADIRVRLRHLREGGFVPAASRKSDDPQIEAVHTAVVLLAHMLGGPQVGIAERVKALWSLPRYPYQTFKSASPFIALSSGRAPATQKGALGELTFGAALTAIVEDACEFKAVYRGETPGAYPQVEVSHDGRFAVIRTSNDEQDVWYAMIEPSGRSYHLASKSVSQTTMLGSIFVDLAYAVLESRRRADRLGVSIPTEDAYQALGYEPPAPGHWTTFPLQPLSPRGLPARAGRPGTKNAAALAGATALRQDQEAAPDSHTVPDAMRQREKPQGQSSHGPGPPYSQRRTSHGRSDSAAASCG